ncbi:TPA: hypothetical protein R5E59_004908 [Enterobacter cloacae]|nr:hypothetical protein [Enterobacter cloacae]HED5646636.1 hypothetical protein [Enterobacter cloacae]
MKISDFIFQFTPTNLSRTDSLCRVRIFLKDNVMHALLTNIDGKYSPASVTNSVEHIRKQLIEKGFISDNTLITEHYEDRLSGYGSFDREHLVLVARPDGRAFLLIK